MDEHVFPSQVPEQATPVPVPVRGVLDRVPAAVQTSVLVGVGLLAGLVGVAALQGSTDPAPATRAVGSTTGLPDRARTPDLPVPRGGVGGETRLVGTLTRVGSGAVTVRTVDGTTTTVPVAAGTQVLEDGAVARLDDLEAGEQVVVHVLADGDGTVAERVLAGSSAVGGPGRRGRGRDARPGDDLSDSGGTAA